MNKFNNLCENIKSDILKNSRYIQTEFNRELSNGWNLLLKMDDIKNNDIQFVVYADNKKFNGNIEIIGEDFEISWETDTPMENEGLIGGEDLNTALKQMVDTIKFSEE